MSGVDTYEKNMVKMNKYILMSALFLFGCKSNEKKCDAYGGNIIVFPPMHTHDLNGNKWDCNEFPADTLKIDMSLSSNK